MGVMFCCSIIAVFTLLGPLSVNKANKSYFSVLCGCPALHWFHLIYEYDMAEMTGPENSLEFPVTTSRVLSQNSQSQHSLMGHIKADMLWPHLSAVLHVGCSCLNLQFQLISLIENI